MRTPFVRRGREEVEVEGVFTAPQRGQPQIGQPPDQQTQSFLFAVCPISTFSFHSCLLPVLSSRWYKCERGNAEVKLKWE